MPGVDAGTNTGAMGGPSDGASPASPPSGTDTGAPGAGNDAGGTRADASNEPGDSGGSDTALPDAGASDGGTDADAALDDAGVHRVVVSGGFNAAGLLTDTWLWGGTGWTQQNISGPNPPRPYAASDRCVHFKKALDQAKR